MPMVGKVVRAATREGRRTAGHAIATRAAGPVRALAGSVVGGMPMGGYGGAARMNMRNASTRVVGNTRRATRGFAQSDVFRPFGAAGGARRTTRIARPAAARKGKNVAKFVAMGVVGAAAYGTYSNRTGPAADPMGRTRPTGVYGY